MTVSKVIELINKSFPENTQYDFDNAGENIIISDNSVSKIVVTLDINMDCIDYAIKNKANLIISHHPIIFHQFKNIKNDILSRKIKKLIKNEISCYSVHTNFDVNLQYGMSKIISEKIFNKSDIKKSSILDTMIIDNKKYGIGNIINLKKNINEKVLVERIIKNLNLSKDLVRLFTNDRGNKTLINKVIIIPGSGSGLIDLVLKERCDLLITSDLKHDQIIDLLDSGIAYFDATHYGVEKHFIWAMSDILDKYKKNIAIKFNNKSL